MRWTWGKSVTQLQYPAKSTRSSRAPMFFSRLRIARTVWGQRYAFFAKRSAGRPLFGGRGAFSSESGISQGQRERRRQRKSIPTFRNIPARAESRQAGQQGGLRRAAR